MIARKLVAANTNFRVMSMLSNNLAKRANLLKERKSFRRGTLLARLL
jgi:hypothetical protein